MTKISACILCLSILFMECNALLKSPTDILSLNDCIELAVQNNPKLAVYKSKIKQKEDSYAIAKTNSWAEIGLNASYNRLSYTPQMKQRFIGNSLDDYQARFGLKQPLYTGGK